MPRTYKPRPKLYTEASVTVAIEEVENGASVRSTANKYHMSTSMLRKRVLAHCGLISLKKQGPKFRLPKETEQKLAALLTRMAELGFGPTLEEFREIVNDYLEANDLLYLFKGKVPGYDWAKSFLERYRLCLKKGGLMQLARKNVTSDPFVIYGFYSLLEKEIKRLGIEGRPECFWNLDESGFPSDASKWKTIGPVGAKTIRVSHGCNRENTTVLAVCCADGSALDPLIVFKGKNMMSNWVGKDALPGTYYATSENGWMTTTIFHTWMEKFCKDVKTRPILLLFDGHLTHTSLETIELAETENITLLKLPAHTTDLLQPLDVACFAPLKSHYEKELTARVHATGAREPLRKQDFVNLLAKIWRKGLTENNIKSGFRATGIYPVDSTKYKIARLDKVKLKTYECWVAAGKPVTENGEPRLTELQLLDECQQQPEQPEPDNPQPSTSQASQGNMSRQASTSMSPSGILQSTPPPQPGSLSHQSSTPTQLTRQLQQFAPTGMKYVVQLVPKEDETTFEAVMKGRGRPTAQPANPPKRHRISMHAAVLSSAEVKKAIESKEKGKQKPKCKKRLMPHNSDSETEDDPEPLTDCDSDMENVSDGAASPFESDAERPEIKNKENSGSNDDLTDIDTASPEKLKRTVERAIKKVELARYGVEPCDIEEGQFYAFKWDRPSTYYWGRVEKILYDDDKDPTEVEVMFMKRCVPSSDPARLRWDWPVKDDKGILSVSTILCGPDKPEVEGKSRGKSAFYFAKEGIAHAKYTEMYKYRISYS